MRKVCDSGGEKGGGDRNQIRRQQRKRGPLPFNSLGVSQWGKDGGAESSTE